MLLKFSYFVSICKMIICGRNDTLIYTLNQSYLPANKHKLNR